MLFCLSILNHLIHIIHFFIFCLEYIRFFYAKMHLPTVFNLVELISVLKIFTKSGNQSESKTLET